MPVVQPEVPAERWQLGEDGRSTARDLASRLRAGPAYYVASNQAKAIQTLEEVARGAPVAIDAGFGEVRHPYLRSDQHRGHARAYVEGTCHDGWEPHRQVAARFDAAVARHAARAVRQHRALVVGTHGMAPTVWLATRMTLPDPGQFWATLGFPDAVHVDLVASTVLRLPT